MLFLLLFTTLVEVQGELIPFINKDLTFLTNEEIPSLIAVMVYTSIVRLFRYFLTSLSLLFERYPALNTVSKYFALYLRPNIMSAPS